MYRIGSNDIIRIQVYGEDDLTVERKVGGDGKIDVPLLGLIRATGRTTEELQIDLTGRLSAGYLKQPQVTVTITRGGINRTESDHDGRWFYGEGQ